jgi:hypothetical protein
MKPTAPRLRALPLVLACLTILLAGCSGDGGSGGDGPEAPMGWLAKEDEETGIGFALPPPATGPEERQRPGLTTPVHSRDYVSQAGELTLSVQFLSTPDRPEALADEVRPDRVPYLVIDQMEAAGATEAQVVSNERVEGSAEPTYDARLEFASGEEEAVWSMRTRALDDVVMVTQAVAIVEDDREQVESQVQLALDRLNGTVDLP